MKIIISCDCGLGDFIVSLPSALKLARRVKLEPIFLVGHIQDTYIKLIPSLSDYHSFTKLESLCNLNEIKAIFSIRTSVTVLINLKTLAKRLEIPLYCNLFHESSFSFFFRWILNRVHFSDLPQLVKSSFLTKASTFCSPQTPDYIVPPLSSLNKPNLILAEYGISTSHYVLLSPAGSDPQRTLTFEQISLIASSIDLPLVVIGNSPLLDIPISPKIIDLVGKTDLKQAIQLIAYSSLAVCMDSAFSHIAGAYSNVKSICIMGNASPMRWGPLPSQKNSHIVYANRSCSPCGRTSCTKFFGNYSCMQHPAFTYNIIRKIQDCLHVSS